MDMAQLMIELHSDPELMQRFIQDPAGVIAEKGGQIPDGVKLKVLKDTAEVRHIVLPHLETKDMGSEEQEKLLSKSFGIPI